jgi:Cdc6-like AAA superfamily ATPase
MGANGASNGVEGEVADFLQFYGLTENPAQGRDFVRTGLAERIVEEVKAKQSVRLLGEAGSGKSALMREVKSILEGLDQRYVVTYAKFNWLIDKQTQDCLSHGGLIALGNYFVKAFDEYFKSTDGKESWPTNTHDNKQGLTDPSNKFQDAVRFFHLQELFEKLKKENYRPVIMLDDADTLQNFEDFDSLDDIIDMSTSTIFCYKPFEEKAMKRNVLRKDDDQTHTELAAQRQRLEAFLRRSIDVYVTGVPATTLLKIMYGKLDKKTDLLTDDALAYGFSAAYSGESARSTALEAFASNIACSGKTSKLYNPGRIGIFLRNCLIFGKEKKSKIIDKKIASMAYEKTDTGLRSYKKIEDIDIEPFLKDVLAAKQKYN